MLKEKKINEKKINTKANCCPDGPDCGNRLRVGKSQHSN